VQDSKDGRSARRGGYVGRCGDDDLMNYDLAGLGPKFFERLCQALAIKILGPGVQVFGAGPDGGREASFDGLLSYPDPSPAGPWSGLAGHAHGCHVGAGGCVRMGGWCFLPTARPLMVVYPQVTGGRRRSDGFWR